MQAKHLLEFAGQVRRFQRWATESQSAGGVAAREALLELTMLYLAALHLPPPFLSQGETEHSLGVGDEEFYQILTKGHRFPLQYYGEVFDPTVIPPEEPVIGDLADDVADVYRDVVTGLRLFDAGLLDDALWNWGFGFRSHWGKHASDAIRAIHCWLASNEPDCLALTKTPQ